MALIEPQSTGVALGGLGELTGYHMRRASGVIAADFAAAVAGTGMRQVLFGILSIVGANPAINQGTVGGALGIKSANMVSLINELVDRGLLDRKVAAEDRRAVALSLTRAGDALVAECALRILAHEQRVFANFTAAERTAFVDFLRRIEAAETLPSDL